MTEYKQLSINDDYGHQFEIVDHIPIGYQIWNVDTIMYDNKAYIPLCQISDGMYANMNTLMAIQYDDSDIIMKALGYGPNTIEDMQKYVARYQNHKDDYRRFTASLMLQALPHMQNLYKTK